MFSRIREDIRTVFAMDPAARTRLEVLFCYPGLHAMWFHRVAHVLWRSKLYFLARLLSHIGRFFTGIEIHPGATIGRRVFIDHGAGVVIGETAEIADDVLMYQGVVLGGTSLEKDKRHPTIERNVVIGSGASVLGPVTIGEGARIGSGSVVVNPVPPGATVVGIPGRIVQDRQKVAVDLEHGDLPDPVAEAIRIVLRSQDELSERLSGLEHEFGRHEVEATLTHLDEHERALLAEFTRGGGI
jgi:serine O-acetyltransferase